MAVISKDLGAVTAYAAAVNRGYTGTKEEFETLMASYATIAQQAAESASNASQSASNASQSAQTAETAKGTAQQAATDAQTAQASAQGFAQSAQQSAQSASQSATDAESAKDTAIDAVDGFAAGAQQALDSVNQAGNNWKSLAQAQKLDAEAWALGTRDGEDVGSSDPAYHNNAKYYAESAGTSTQTATEAAQTATQKAGEAAQSASAAAESARTLTIDATLTQNGQAADAKETGDKITSLKEDINSKADNITETYVGENSVTFHAESAGSLQDLSLSLPLKIAGSGVPSPTNIRKISAYESDSFSFNDETINVIFDVDDNVYAGHYDVVNGKLTATMAVVELDNSEWYSVTIGGMSGVRRIFPTLKIQANYDNYYCSHLKNEGHVSAGFTDDGVVNLAANYYNVVFVSTSNFTSVTTFIAWLDAQRANNTPVQFAYPLAESIEYDITPETIEAILGDNNITATDRNISVTTTLPLSALKENVDGVSNAIEPYTEIYTKQLEPNKKRNICHLGVSKTNNIIIPSQSLADIDRAKRLGFEMIELNVRKTSDGKYLCFHGSGGKFGEYFTDVNGNSVADLSPADMTLAEIQNNIRYKTIYDRYKTAPYTLEECLTECLKKGIKPLIEYHSSYTDELSIVDSIMGKNNYGLATYTADREDVGSDATMYSYLSISNPDAVLAKCEASGGSYVAGINVTSNVYSDYAEDDWKTLVGKLHAKGYKVSYAYASESLSQLLNRCGFDYNNSSRQVNDFDYGNIVNICDTPTFSGFNTTGTINSGVMTLATNDTVTLTDNVSSVFLGMCCMSIRFVGTLQIKCGEINTSYTSNGKEMLFISSFCEESAPDMLITANANTVIYSLSFKSSEV